MTPIWPWHFRSQNYLCSHIIIMPPRLKFSSVSLDEQVLSYGPVCKKCTDQRWPWHFQCQKHPYFRHMPPRLKCSHILLDEPNLEKRTPNDLKWSWHLQAQKYPYAFHIYPWNSKYPCSYIIRPNFRLFHSTMSRFWVRAQFGYRMTRLKSKFMDSDESLYCFNVANIRS